ncbi:DNA polymerase II large subunit [Candidatus Woesearchaeota archaeon]|nr:DNA polymerase II large subunit [Candidatus Woesearchaeota archaeon]
MTKTDIKPYFDEMDLQIKQGYQLANQARACGIDPEKKVDIPLAKGISERVEGLVSAAAPQILHGGVAQRIRKLEKEFGSLDWRVALKIAEEVAKQKLCKFESKLKAMETGIRVGLAYITLGVIAAPLEGFIELKIKKRLDTKEYLSAWFAGPIRAAGGTAEAVSLVIADYVRIKMGYEKYDPEEKEIKRSVVEIRDYHDSVTNLQYLPSEEEVVFLLKHLPVEVNGDPTEEKEVSNYKDLPRVETNRIRGGLCLVIAEGLAQKAPKLYKELRKWGPEFGLEWEFLNEFIKLQKKIKAQGKATESDSTITPNYTYIKDLVAGRPVLSSPLKPGGFRLRYGRTRISGFAASAIHPATMQILNRIIATGTQLKIERPGKATAIVVCDSIDGPIVKLANGSVVKLTSEKEAKQIQHEVKEILFLGDLLINYGDFSENGHKLVPAGYCEEWWIKHFENAVIGLFGTIDIEKCAEIAEIKKEHLSLLFSNPIKTKVSFQVAHRLSKIFKIPLHPEYTYFWNLCGIAEVILLMGWIKEGNIEEEENKIRKIILHNRKECKEILERIGVQHNLVNNEYVIIEKEHAEAFFAFSHHKYCSEQEITDTNAASFLSNVIGITIMDKGGTFIGARMGRPEKSKMRKLSGAPHVLFPVGNEGGRLRSFQSAMEKGKVTADLPLYRCDSCQNETPFLICEKCNKPTNQLYYCNSCGALSKKCGHDFCRTYKNQSININYYFDTFLEKLDTKIFPDLIKGVRGTSNKSHITEHLIKGILRAKHNVYVNKDGTTRYDMIELPITHFKPSEINVSVEKLKELGYNKDIHGRELVDRSQILELYPQDVILPSCPDSPDEGCDRVLYRVSKFIDELLIYLYGLKPYYNLKSEKDLVGQLIIGLAPHTSAGIVGRIIGFSKTQAMFAHPLLHAAMRRNCDGDEACAILFMDALLNFSRSFLPDKRGSRTMDAPLVLTSLLIPSEVDDEVHGMDIVWSYPLTLYDLASKYTVPWNIDILQIDNVLGTYKQYLGQGYTHEVEDINAGVLCSAYKLLPTMEEKLKSQMDLAEKIHAVAAKDVATLVIEKHFLKDIKGNLRKFSTQQFRCVDCNTKYRRPPLAGKCAACGGRIIFTVSEGSIVKYLKPTIELAEKYNVDPYLKQSIELLNRRIVSVLGKEKETQVGLTNWI